MNNALYNLTEHWALISNDSDTIFSLDWEGYMEFYEWMEKIQQMFYEEGSEVTLKEEDLLDYWKEGKSVEESFEEIWRDF